MKLFFQNLLIILSVAVIVESLVLLSQKHSMKYGAIWMILGVGLLVIGLEKRNQ